MVTVVEGDSVLVTALFGPSGSEFGLPRTPRGDVAGRVEAEAIELLALGVTIEAAGLA